MVFSPQEIGTGIALKWRVKTLAYPHLLVSSKEEETNKREVSEQQ